MEDARATLQKISPGLGYAAVDVRGTPEAPSREVGFDLCCKAPSEQLLDPGQLFNQGNQFSNFRAIDSRSFPWTSSLVKTFRQPDTQFSQPIVVERTGS